MSPLALQKGRAPCRRARALQKGAALQKGHGPAEGPRALQKGAACRRATLIYLCLRAPPFGSAFFAFEFFFHSSWIRTRRCLPGCTSCRWQGGGAGADKQSRGDEIKTGRRFATRRFVSCRAGVYHAVSVKFEISVEPENLKNPCRFHHCEARPAEQPRAPTGEAPRRPHRKRGAGDPWLAR